jgi:hypothetical protein
LSCDLAPFLCGDRLDETGRDELAERGFGDTYVSANPHEADAALFDQATGEAFGGAQDGGGFGHGQQPLGWLVF